MQVVNLQLIHGKKVLLRLDIDVPIENGQVIEDFRLRLGLPTLKLCLEHAAEVIVMGHIGRPQYRMVRGGPEGQVVPELSVEPIRQWLPQDKKLTVLENLRFDPREEACDPAYAGELASMGDVYINEAFAAYRPSVSTTVLPTLLPGYAGLRFAQEVKVLSGVRDNPKKPFIAIMGGAKVEDKLPVIKVLAQKADVVLVGGKIVSSIKYQVSRNILLGKLNKEETDLASETVESWENLIMGAKMIVWNGPVGKIENGKLPAPLRGARPGKIENLGSAKGTFEIARMVLESNAEIIIGGGDTVAFLGTLGMLEEYEKKAFVSTGGGAMLKFLAEGTLDTIKVL